jgi:hypothetical protein
MTARPALAAVLGALAAADTDDGFEPVGHCSRCGQLVAVHPWGGAAYHGSCRGWGQPIRQGTS